MVGCRPTINAVMFAEATAIAAAAAAAGNATLSAHFEEEAARWRGVVLERLWSEDLPLSNTLAQPPRPNHNENGIGIGPLLLHHPRAAAAQIAARRDQVVPQEGVAGRGGSGCEETPFTHLAVAAGKTRRPRATASPCRPTSAASPAREEL